MINASQAILVIAVCAIITGIERVLPFIVFKDKEPPEVVKYIGRTLPLAIMALMVLFAFKGISFDEAANFAPQLIAGAVCFATHLWKRNMILTIIVGTVLYMILVQIVF